MISSIVTFMVQQKGGAVGSIESFPLGTRVANALVSYVIYIEKCSGRPISPSSIPIRAFGKPGRSSERSCFWLP